VTAQIIANARRADAVHSARQVASELAGAGVSILAERDSAPALTLDAVPPEQFGRCDVLMAFGGDGTLIRAAHGGARFGTPIIGVYFGRFGFVTQCTAEDALRVALDFVAGRYRTDDRMMLRAELMRSGQTVAELHALNEISLQRSVDARMMVFRVEVDDTPLTTYPADGILVCTATGSTAYNLSAGGPILEPHLEAMVLTAIAPHTLSSRPLVLGPQSRLVLRVGTEGEAVLAADGITRLHILSGDTIRVTRSDRVTRLVVVKDNDFLHKLGQRLFWSKGLVEESA
jgi:NAD+ kinase